MPLFKQGEKVNFRGHQVTVENVYNEGRKADLVCEIIPFMPTHFMGIGYEEVSR